MPRTRHNSDSLAVVQKQIGRMQAALAELQLEIARLSRRQAREAAPPPASLREARQTAERDFLVEVGERCQWNRTRMARSLHIDRKALYRRMKSLALLAAHPAPSGRFVRQGAPRSRPKPSRRR